MSSAWRKTLIYLGLVEEPEDYEELPDQYGREREAPRAEPAGDRRSSDWWGERGREEGREADVRPLRVPEPGAPHVRAMAADGKVRVTVIEVRDFDDCEQIGARYRAGHPVLFDLLGVDTATGRRVLDFVSGVTFALRGRLSKVGTRAFLLVPDGVEVPPEERRRLAGLGYGAGG